MPAELAALTTRCENAGTRLLVLHDLEGQVGRPLSFVRDDGFYFISLRQEPLECPLNRLVKRTIDVAVSLPVVLLLLPWTSFAVWLIHRFQSPGPLFFRQPRTGLHNEEFSIFKYRTMRVGHGREADQATAGDSRVFPLGHWLRKLSVDELPQFINVLKGEMSIVGPRPHLSEHDAMWAKFAHFYRVRSFIKPGITGLAQVRGLRGEAHTQEQVRDRLQSDLYYLENWSPTLDSLIILRTAWQVMRPPRSAY
jgi:lipopolysaccharide/colanic/teichoic acid biosynthesis glycosyltransferase